MAKISDIRGADVVDFVADVVAPAIAIVTDTDLRAALSQTTEDNLTSVLLGAIPSLIKAHRDDVIAILAAVNCVSVEEYAADLTVFKLIKDVSDLITDDDFTDFFGSALSSGATASTESGFTSTTTDTLLELA